MSYPALLHSTTPSPPLYNPLPCPTPLQSTNHTFLFTLSSPLPYPTLPYSTSFYHPSRYPTPLHYTLPYLPTLSPLHITLPYHPPSPPLLHSTPLMSLHSTFPSPPLYPTHPSLPNSILPSPPLSPSLPYHALYLTLPNSPLPYHTLLHSTLPPLRPSNVLPFTVPYHAVLHSTIFSHPLPCPHIWFKQYLFEINTGIYYIDIQTIHIEDLNESLRLI